MEYSRTDQFFKESIVGLSCLIVLHRRIELAADSGKVDSSKKDLIRSCDCTSSGIKSEYPALASASGIFQLPVAAGIKPKSFSRASFCSPAKPTSLRDS
jgi:hypothetical protein